MRLFDRTNRGVAPTPHGEVLLRRATGVFEELRQAVNELRALADAAHGELRIGGATVVVGRDAQGRARQVLGVAESDVLAELDAGSLKGRKIGTQWRITKDAVDAFLKG